MNLEVIAWTLITTGVLVAVYVAVMSLISAKNMKKRREEMGKIHTTLRVGSKIIFAGGLYGHVVKINKDETVDVEISKGNIVTASRYSIQDIVK